MALLKNPPLAPRRSPDAAAGVAVTSGAVVDAADACGPLEGALGDTPTPTEGSDASTATPAAVGPSLRLGGSGIGSLTAAGTLVPSETSASRSVDGASSTSTAWTPPTAPPEVSEDDRECLTTCNWRARNLGQLKLFLLVLHLLLDPRLSSRYVGGFSFSCGRRARWCCVLTVCRHAQGEGRKSERARGAEPRKLKKVTMISAYAGLRLIATQKRGRSGYRYGTAAALLFLLEP